MKPSEFPQAQPRAWSILSRSFLSGRIASAYLFHGPDGCGDWPLSLCLAALLNCAKPIPGGNESVFPCGTCTACRTTLSYNHPGFKVVVPIPSIKKEDDAIDHTNSFIESRRQEPFALLYHSKPISIPISLARKLRRDLSLKAQDDVTRMVLLYRIDLMRPEAADALLKLIEEPPAETVLVLTASNLESVSDTIKSRCQTIRLERVPESFALEYLTSVHDLDSDRAQLVHRLADGSLGRALAMVTRETGAADRRSVGLMLFRTLCRAEASELASQLFDMFPLGDRSAVQDLLALWQSLTRDCAYYAATGDESGIVNSDYTTEIKNLSTCFRNSAANARLVELYKNTLDDLTRNVHIQLSLVAMALRFRQELPDSTGASATE